MKPIRSLIAATAMAVLLVGAGPTLAADEIVLGLTMIQSGPLKSPGEGTEVAVDIAVAEINAAGGINGKKLRVVKFDTGTDPKQAVVAARTKIVDGAVGMVEMALDRLKRDDIVDLDEERRATMVSNLLVVLCSDRHTQPVINTGSLYN